VRDAKSKEDLIRRLQTVVFSPLAQVNGWYIPNPPWKQLERKKNNAGELMEDWETLEARCREILGWRMQMVPYLRAAFARYAENGTPPFRALALDWPDVPEVAKVDDAWMVGDRMLVAPLFAGEPGRTLTLPPGDWNNFWTGERIRGGTKMQFSASYKNIPVFVKAGSVMPMAFITNSTADATSCELIVKIFGDGHLPFSIETKNGFSLQLSWSAGHGKVVQSDSSHYHIRRWENA
jgi:alpha-D-xyloside xylohydrolase